MKKIMAMGNKNIFISGNISTTICYIQLVSENEFKTIENLEKSLRNSTACDFLFVAIPINDWNRELSPWRADAVFSNEPFGGHGNFLLSYLKNEILPALTTFMCKNRQIYFYLGGYSLAGLFSLWASCETSLFYGIAAVSPSVWFPNWEEYIHTHKTNSSIIYLSLGNKEANTKNKLMKTVADKITLQYNILVNTLGKDKCILEWNEGNHFMNVNERITKALPAILP